MLTAFLKYRRKPGYGKRTKCFILLEKHKNFTWAIRPQDTMCFFVRKHELQLQWHQQQTLRCCGLERAVDVGAPPGV